VEREYRPKGRVTILGNGVDPAYFRPLDKISCRRALDLPLGAKLIGTAGSITRDRGVGDLFQAFEALAKLDENIWLVYAGPRDGTPLQHPHPRIRDLGLLPHTQIPKLLSALDVAIVCNRDSEFGRFCYPMKLEEAIACGTPVVAAQVGDVAARLSEDDGCLYQPGNWSELATKIGVLLGSQTATGTRLAANTWASLVLTLQQALNGSLSQPGHCTR
jgi:glycosyltransferase involved in cell wall biosynthesis